MRKVNAIVSYDGNTNQIYNITVTTRQSHTITLLQYNPGEVPEPYKYKCFNDAYKSILQILKNNGFYCDYYIEFGCYWYSVLFIEISNPYKVVKLPYRTEV